MPSQLLTELDDSADGCAAMFVETGLAPAVRAALLMIIQRDITEARRERPDLQVQIRRGAAVSRPAMELIYFVVDPDHVCTTTPDAA